MFDLLIQCHLRGAGYLHRTTHRVFLTLQRSAGTALRALRACGLLDVKIPRSSAGRNVFFTSSPPVSHLLCGRIGASKQPLDFVPKLLWPDQTPSSSPLPGHSPPVL